MAPEQSQLELGAEPATEETAEPAWRFRCCDPNCKAVQAFSPAWTQELTEGWVFKCRQCDAWQIAKLNLPHALFLDFSV